jgi:hypothetical protein
MDDMELNLRKLKTEKDSTPLKKTVGNVSFSQDTDKMKKTLSDAIKRSFTGVSSQVADIIEEKSKEDEEQSLYEK